MQSADYSLSHKVLKLQSCDMPSALRTQGSLQINLAVLTPHYRLALLALSFAPVRNSDSFGNKSGMDAILIQCDGAGLAATCVAIKEQSEEGCVNAPNASFVC